MKKKHVWIIEYHGLGGWELDANQTGHYKSFRTRKAARYHMKNHHDGHSKDLRVQKYIRAKSVKELL